MEGGQLTEQETAHKEELEQAGKELREGRGITSPTGNFWKGGGSPGIQYKSRSFKTHSALGRKKKGQRGIQKNLDHTGTESVMTRKLHKNRGIRKTPYHTADTCK